MNNEPRETSAVTDWKLLDWELLNQDIDPSCAGDRMDDRESATVDWEKVAPEKFKVIPVQGREGSPFFAVVQTFIAMHSAEYVFPGRRLYDYFMEHPERVPGALKNSGFLWLNFLGTLIRDERGQWSTLYQNGEFERKALHLTPIDHEWREEAIVVVVK